MGMTQSRVFTRQISARSLYSTVLSLALARNDSLSYDSGSVCASVSRTRAYRLRLLHGMADNGQMYP